MDPKDFDIVTTLMDEPEVSLAELGRRLGLSHTAVAARLERLREVGVLNGLVGLPRPALFGLEGRVWFWLAPRAPVDDPAELLEAPGVVVAVKGHHGGVGVVAYSLAAAPPPAELVARLGEPTDGGMLRQGPTKAARWTPGRVRVMARLVDDPRTSVADLAQETGLSRPTVKRYKSEALTGAMEVMPLLDAVDAQGILLFQVHALARDETALRRLQETAAPTARVRAATRDPAGVVLFGRAASLLEVFDLERRLGAVPGVEFVNLMAPLRTRVATARLKEWLDGLAPALPTSTGE